jgi:hypothetical protein
VREALRRLAANERVLGIAAAIAIGYAVVALARSVVTVTIDLLSDETRGGYLVVAARGVDVTLDALLVSAATAVAVVAGFALLLRRADG